MAHKTHYSDEVIVTFSWDLPECECCPPKKHRSWCPVHSKHFDDCPCVGANDGDYIYFERNGILYARPHQKNTFLERVGT